ncbi:phage tail tip lysozyme [Rhizobium sp. RCC_161_2]|uniref:phage tail tip lysozyme n=1 Tax=Rhizobium sp. RCC_161_2 TaxID=3239219 RepID=UPI003524B2FF
MTTAQLGFAIDSSSAAGAASDLDRLTTSSGKAEQAANKVSIAATKASRGFGDISPALDRLIAGLSRLEATASSIDQRLAAMAKSAKSAAAANRSLAETTSSVQASQSKGASTATQATAAIDRQRQATERLNAAQRASNRAPAAANQNRGAQNFQTANVAAQFQDIAVTSAMGMSPLQIALQQGTQLSAVLGPMGATGAVKGLAAAFLSVISPVSLVTLALVGGAAAAIQYFSSAGKESKTLEKLLDEQVAAIKRIKDVWGEAATARSQYGRESSGSASFGLETNISEMTKKLREANAPTTFGPGAVSSSVTDAINKNIGATGLTARQFRETSLFKTLSIDFQQLQKVTVEGKPDVLGLVSSLEDIGRSANNAGIKAIAQDAVAALQPFKDLAQAIRDAEVERLRLFDSVGPNAMALSQGLIAQADSNQSAIYESRNRVAAERQRKALDAQIMGINARSPSDREAAARASAAATYNNDEDPTQRNQRINDAAQISRVQSEKQLADAARDRAMNLDKILQDQQTDISLIGKTGGAAAALRKEYELTSALRMEAARQGIDVDKQEIEAIKQKSAELGKLTDTYNQGRFNFDINQQNSDAQLSPRDRQIVQTQRQYSLSENPNDANGKAIGQQLDWQDAKNTAKQFGSAFSNELISGSHNIGKSFLKGFQSSIENGAQKLWEKLFDGVGTTFANWITGSKGLAGTQAGAANGAVALGGKLLGGTSGTGQAAATTSQTGVAAQAWNFFAGKGLHPHQIAGVLGNISAESGFNSKAVGDAGKAFGLFQNHAARGGGSALLSSGVDGQLNHAWNELQGPENKAYQALMKSTDVRGATAAFAGFERPRGFSLGNPEGADNFSGRLSAANDALNKFGTTTNQATQGVGALGNGLGQLGTSLGSGAAGAATGAGGGGLFGWLGNLFKPAASASSGFNIGSNMVPFKGFATGTNYAPGGPAIVGENGPELMNLPQGSQVTSNHKLMSALAANSNNAPQASQSLMVNVQGANGDDHVRTLVQQGVGAALSDYNTQQRRGGVGVLQARYSNQKV